MSQAVLEILERIQRLPEEDRVAMEREQSHSIRNEMEEDFLEPLVFDWSEDKFIVAQAVRYYMAQFDADY